MTESCNPIAHFSILFLTFITSHPLYLSYFIFFSPYLLKLFSFLSPLFLTTLLVCFTFLTLLERLLRPDNNDSSGADLEIYDIVFGNVLEEEESSCCTAIPENHVDKVIVVVEENQNVQDSVQKVVVEEVKGEEKEKRLENFLQILDQFERMSGTTTKKKKAKDDLVVERKDGSDVQSSKMRSSLSSSRSQSVSFSSVGSMRKEKEWNRTLACKLFEERHHEGGGEGMDSLWETYEETNCSDVKANNSRMSKMKNKKKSQVQFDQEEEEEDAEIVTGQLCCLQALKMSTGKMNLGMKKPNLVKISKAIKGFGWLHSFSKHSSKKVHNSTDSTRYY